MNQVLNTMLAVVFLAGFLAACSEQTHSVEYYTEHKDERATKLEECKDNPGELRMTPNCVNAGRSQVMSDFSSTNKGMPNPNGW